MRLASIALALLLASGGCSFGARVSQPKACTPVAWPIVDSAFTVATAVPVVAATTGDRRSVGYAIAITPLTLALAASAAYGYVRWSRCPKPPAPQDPYAQQQVPASSVLPLTAQYSVHDRLLLYVEP